MAKYEKDDVVDLDELPHDQLADLYCKLNRGDVVLGPGANCTVLQIMRAIEAKIGERACLRAWNEHMSDEDFEIFWKAHEAGEGSMADQEYERRLQQRVDDEENGRG